MILQNQPTAHPAAIRRALGIQTRWLGNVAINALEVVSDGWQVRRIVNRNVMNAMPRRFQLRRKIAHPRKNSEYFLRMVQHVIGLLAQLHQHVNDVVVDRCKPAVQRVELVAQDQSERTFSRIFDHISAIFFVFLACYHF